MGVATAVPLGVFAMVVLIVWAVVAYRYKSHAKSMRVLEAMAGRGDPIDPELVRALGVKGRSRHADLRTGVVLLAIGLATVVFGFGVDSPSEFIGFGAFPGLLGVVFIGLWALVTRREND